MNSFNYRNCASSGENISEMKDQERKQRAKKMEDQSKTTSQAGTDNNAQAQLGSTGNSLYYWCVTPIENKKSIQNQEKKKTKTTKATMHSKKRKTSDHRTKTSLDNMLKLMNSQTKRDEAEDEAFIKYEQETWACPSCQYENTNDGSYCTNVINGRVCGTNRPSKVDPKGWGDTFKDQLQRPLCSVCTTPLQCQACGK